MNNEPPQDANAVVKAVGQTVGMMLVTMVVRNAPIAPRPRTNRMNRFLDSQFSSPSSRAQRRTRAGSRSTCARASA